jgi:hypothetical protein
MANNFINVKETKNHLKKKCGGVKSGNGIPTLLTGIHEYNW